LGLKEHGQAKESYQEVLSLYETLKDLDDHERGLEPASIYHQLGIVAEELREYGEARQNYQLALAILSRQN
jgi:tetratricopeptide (TPR) repeat protein